MGERAEVPEATVLRISAIMRDLPGCAEESAWVGVRWRVGGDTVAHVFGGEDVEVSEHGYYRFVPLRRA